jgi:MFS family permease
MSTAVPSTAAPNRRRDKGRALRALPGHADDRPRRDDREHRAPVLKDDLAFSDGNLTWVLNAYLIPFGGLLMLSGRIGDLIGQRRMFLWGMSLFTFASLLCGVAASQEVLIAARFLQGVGGALGSSVILGMIITLFRDPREQGEAIGIYSFVASAGGSLGLLLGGILTDALSWNWIFLVNLPIGIATVLLARQYVPTARAWGSGSTRSTWWARSCSPAA